MSRQEKGRNLPNRFSKTDEGVRTEPEFNKDATGRLHVHSPDEDDREELLAKERSARCCALRKENGILTKEETMETIVSCTV